MLNPIPTKDEFLAKLNTKTERKFGDTVYDNYLDRLHDAIEVSLTNNPEKIKEQLTEMELYINSQIQECIGIIENVSVFWQNSMLGNNNVHHHDGEHMNETEFDKFLDSLDKEDVLFYFMNAFFNYVSSIFDAATQEIERLSREVFTMHQEKEAEALDRQRMEEFNILMNTEDSNNLGMMSE